MIHLPAAVILAFATTLPVHADTITYSYEGLPMDCVLGECEIYDQNSYPPNSTLNWGNTGRTGSFTIDESLVPGGSIANTTYVFDYISPTFQLSLTEVLIVDGNVVFSRDESDLGPGQPWSRPAFITSNNILELSLIYDGFTNTFLQFGANGELEQWTTGYYNNGGCNGGTQYTVSSLPNDWCTGLYDTIGVQPVVLASSAPGTWTMTRETTPAPVPLPAPALLLAAALAGLGLVRSRTR